jgi:ADP-ribose pyrophosphatase
MANPEFPETLKFKARMFDVKDVEVNLPDGKIRSYELVDISNAVMLLPIDAGNNVYLVEQFRVGAKRSLLELPAGKIEPQEDPNSTALRELREETGMAANELKLIGKFFMSPGYSTEYMYCYLATGLFPSPLAPDADEFLALRKIPLPVVFEMINRGEIEDSKTLAAFSLARTFLKYG